CAREPLITTPYFDYW
nr:immunoglobulin heavy chain junction region [Mus musculus]